MSYLARRIGKFELIEHDSEPPRLTANGLVDVLTCSPSGVIVPMSKRKIPTEAWAAFFEACGRYLEKWSNQRRLPAFGGVPAFGGDIPSAAWNSFLEAKETFFSKKGKPAPHEKPPEMIDLEGDELLFCEPNGDVMVAGQTVSADSWDAFCLARQEYLERVAAAKES